MKTLKSILSFTFIVLLSCAISMTLGALVLVITDNMEAFFSVFFFGGILVALALGAFD